ncbi:hypothetical protein KUV22_06795 [Microbulbifer agarilyticus]|uniref:hypothetical protein n=1 Tax=Microbulbifer agarilyticus TaxID=260552 RepID=UPI001C9673EC|nr:hypothetical protein [Microbulbifer agarilyticus]MBY6190126.1 hypothetical protein [Microbulbifer agarilyticus]
MDDNQRKDCKLALHNRGRIRHFSSIKSIHSLRSGSYKILHFDCSDIQSGLVGGLNVSLENPLEFEVKNEEVTYLGTFILKKAKQAGAFEVGLSAGMGLLDRVCEHSPEVLAPGNINMGLINWSGKAEFEYQCKKSKKAI